MAYFLLNYKQAKDFIIRTENKYRTKKKIDNSHKNVFSSYVLIIIKNIKK